MRTQIIKVPNKLALSVPDIFPPRSTCHILRGFKEEHFRCLHYLTRGPCQPVSLNLFYPTLRCLATVFVSVGPYGSWSESSSQLSTDKFLSAPATIHLGAVIWSRPLSPAVIRVDYSGPAHQFPSAPPNLIAAPGDRSGPQVLPLRKTSFPYHRVDLVPRWWLRSNEGLIRRDRTPTIGNIAIGSSFFDSQTTVRPLIGGTNHLAL